MGASFIELAQAVRETHTIGLQTIARLVGIADADELDVMRARKALLLETADLLVEQAPHEALIRSIVRVGGLAELPEYSANLSLRRVGAIGLWRGEILDMLPLESEVRFKTVRGVTRSWVSHSENVGIERVAPSMWLGPAPVR